MSASMNEKLNAEIQATFAAREVDTVDGLSNSKVYGVNSDKFSTKNETVVSKYLSHIFLSSSIFSCNMNYRVCLRCFRIYLKNCSIFSFPTECQN